MSAKDPRELDFFDANHVPTLDRRDFLKAFGGGIVVMVSLAESWGMQERQGGRGGFGGGLPTDFNAFLIVREDGTVACLTGKIEMGQGVITSLAQMMADELDVPLDAVEMVMGDTDLCPWDMGTFGSMTTRSFGPAMRAAAAEARGVLLALAADELRRPVHELATKDGFVYDTRNPGTKIAYGRLAKGKKIERRLEAKPPVKATANFKVVGKPMLRRDAREKVTGRAKYAGDISFPGMLHARLVRPPAHGAKLLEADTSEAETLPGVRVVRDGELIAVLHESPDACEAALAKVKARFEAPSAGPDDKTIYDHLLGVAPKGEASGVKGSLEEGEKLAESVVETTFLNAYVAHAPIEPHTATARIEDGKATVWISTQRPFGDKDEIVRALGVPAAGVRVVTPFVGGGFGGKTSNQQAVEAARLAKATGRPVQVAWSRREEFFYDTFRPAAIVKIKAGVTKAGTIALWDYSVYFAGQRGSDHFYDIPHSRTTVHGSGWTGGPGTHPFATGAWRAPSNNTNTFARESEIDILAARARMDPVEFRLRNLKDPRMIRVLKAVADKAGWKPAVPPSGRGYGVACGIDAGTYVAHIAEADVDKASGRIRVKRVIVAQEMGLVINPAGARLQMEGCITMGLGYALTEEVHFRNGAVLDANFDTYEIPRFSWTPAMETVILDAHDSPPQGGGEPAIIGMGAVTANAVYDAIGIRLLQLPMTPERVKAAVAKGPQA